MVLPTLSYEDIVNEVWNNRGQLRDKKKKLRLHAIEELAAHQLTVLPVVTSPCLLSPASSRKALFLVICHFCLSNPAVLLFCFFNFSIFVVVK